ncbi:MAG TPA: trypsin-like peptidase domain-containing protein [Planctomycetota bacterium]|nr:trypsin-like peptidase domain-containing protein [Planctomycetota bacterium]
MPRSRRVLSTCIAAALICVLGAGVPDEESLKVALAESRAIAAAAAAVRKGVVMLRAFGAGGKDAYGSGILVAPEGLVLTALHVVDGASAISVTLDDGDELAGRVRASDRSVDLALLEIVAPGRTFPTAPLAEGHVLDVGETVLAVSNPFGLGTSVSRGILSAVGRRNVVEGQEAPLLQTDAAINPGSSGGALVNLNGEVIGLITAIITRSGGHEGVGLAVPAGELRRALAELSKGEAPPRAWLGVRVRKEPVPGQGLKILEVEPKGPAASAGVQDGDVLRSLDGRSLSQIEDLRTALDEARAGDTLVAEVARQGERLSVRIHVGAKD